MEFIYFSGVWDRLSGLAPPIMSRNVETLVLPKGLDYCLRFSVLIYTAFRESRCILVVPYLTNVFALKNLLLVG